MLRAVNVLAKAVAVLGCLGLLVVAGFAQVGKSIDTADLPISIAGWRGPAYFIGAAIVLGLVIGLTARAKCRKCGEYAGRRVAQEHAGSSYQHERSDGERDRRYKANAQTLHFKVKYRCGACGHTWKQRESK